MEDNLSSTSVGGVEAEDRLAELEVDVAEVVEEPGVDGGRGAAEVVIAHALVRLPDGPVKPREDPSVLRLQVLHDVGERLDLVALEVHHGELGGVPELVAEMTVALDTKNVEINVSTLAGVGAESKTKSVGTALGDAVGKIFFLPLLSLHNFLGVQITLLEACLKVLEGDALDDIEGVDDVPEGLRHLPAVRVSDHGVKEDSVEGNLSCQLHPHHHHAGYPEEEDVPAGL
mmetsp:Transcript_20794/g.69432  ORF Transcript_20794/g.69432 Transcript_20794/m.69432 type:complete len:230 (+) Transcript_20794:691-1380(+)